MTDEKRPDLDDLSFIEHAYMEALGRPPDPQGMKGYLGRLKDTTSRLAVLLELRNSAEGLANSRLQSGEADASDSELPATTLAKAARMTLPQFWGVNDDAFLQLAYYRLLGRQIDAAGRRDYLARLLNGVPRALVLEEIQGSAEGRLQGVTLEGLAQEVKQARRWRSRASVLLRRLRRPANAVTANQVAQPSRGAVARPIEALIAPDELSQFHHRPFEIELDAPGGLPDLMWPALFVGVLGTDVRPGAPLAGLFQFSLQLSCNVAVQCAEDLKHVAGPTTSREELLDQRLLATAHLPMSAFENLPPKQRLGRVLAVELVSCQSLSVRFKAAERGALHHLVFEAFQATTGGDRLELLTHLDVEVQGQTLVLDIPLRTVLAPVLIVVTDLEHEILLTDCIPLPLWYAASQRPLLEYHRLLSGDSDTATTASVLGLAHLLATLKAQSWPSSSNCPARAKTAVLLYGREQQSVRKDRLALLKEWGCSVGELGSDGRVALLDGTPVTLADFAAAKGVDHLLFIDDNSTPRPDFWSLLEQNQYRLEPATELIYWHSVGTQGTDCMFLAKPGLLLDTAFLGHATFPLRCALIDQRFLLKLLPKNSALFRSGNLQLEQILAAAAPIHTACIPLALDTVEWPVAPSPSTRLLPVPATRCSSLNANGLTVILHLGECPEETRRCLLALRAQVLKQPIEVVVLRHRATPPHFNRSVTLARELFGHYAVQTIEMGHGLNLSAQCNTAARVARQELLLILASHCVLQEPTTLASACALSVVPWVGTVGFCQVSGWGEDAPPPSLGLALSPQPLLLQAGSPLVPQRLPDFLLPYTQETLGNNLAATVVRRQVYLSMGGLDDDAFPNSHADIDFCNRALSKGLRHVSMGLAQVQLLRQRSSSEALTASADHRLNERCQSLARLTATGISCFQPLSPVIHPERKAS